MAAAGDSITRAFNIDWCCWLADSPEHSWSTGDAGLVNSHYQRLLALNPAIAGHNYNVARSGATMSELAGQLSNAAALKVEYVTILIGTNDLCTATADTMTPTAAFTDQFNQALADFTTADPGAKIFVASLPDLYQLWSLWHDDAWVSFIWDSFGVCQSMLASTNSEADRQRVVARELEYNSALATTCARYAPCRWDGGAVYGFKFPATDASDVDHFHPNFDGQRDLAEVSWRAGYWGA
jgi:lysophospholipase L1-like esterase